MKMPWTNQTGLAKVATILGCIFMVSLGLCGMNLFVVSINQEFAVMAGIAESAGMVLSGAGLAIVVLICFVRELVEYFKSK